MAESPSDVTPTARNLHGERNTLLADEIREEPIFIQTLIENKLANFAFCDACFASNFSKPVAHYLCNLCEKYVCSTCVTEHNSHGLVERMGENYERAMGDFLEKFEIESQGEERFQRQEITVVNRVNVSNSFDERGCGLRRICGFGTGWVVCDNQNKCIKLFSSGDCNSLKRYIRLGSKPHDITSIAVRLEPTGQNTASTSHDPYTPVTDQSEQHLLAVTLPLVRLILILDVESCPAVRIMSIKSKAPCLYIEFSEGKLYALCLNGEGWFIDVMSTGGDTLETIDTGVHVSSYISDFAVCQRGIFITKLLDNTITCINHTHKDRELFHRPVELSTLTGICVDRDSDIVYVVGKDRQGRRQIYKSDSTLVNIQPVCDTESLKVELIFYPCFHRDKLFINSILNSCTDENVTLVRVL